MIHDPTRVESIRSRALANVQLLSALEIKFETGALPPQLQIARNQLKDVERFFLARIGRESMTAAEEARWLDGAEHMLQAWVGEVQRVSEQFKGFGPGQIEIIGG
jgi:hypothetical protein